MRDRILRVLAGSLVMLGWPALPAGAQNSPPGVEPGAVLQPPAKPTGPIPYTSCVTSECHANIKQDQFTHGPVNVNACDACHEPVSVEEHTFRLAREESQLCLFCHQVDVLDMPVVHEPLRTGQCMECHAPHGGFDRKLLRSESVGQLCAGCHEDVIRGKTVVHGPVAGEVCSACHAPHASEYPNLLAASGTELCLQCHVTTAEQLATLRVVHGPAAADCQACHDAHASDYPMMLVEDPATLCQSCHDAIQQVIETAVVKHGAVTEEGGCTNCHSPHASDFAMILKQDEVSMCLDCHDQQVRRDDGEKIREVASVLRNSTHVHGPIAQGDCAGCHEVHGGANFRLLTFEYPSEFYAPFAEESYALCFSCHDRSVVLEEKTATLTNFRNGETNLHYLHVNKERKGRTCRACHETHASNNPRHIRQSVPFGPREWELPINFEMTQDGGSCAPGCHKQYEYDRVNPVVYEQPLGFAGQQAGGPS